jgi:hypothetical protein
MSEVPENISRAILTSAEFAAITNDPKITARREQITEGQETKISKFLHHTSEIAANKFASLGMFSDMAERLKSGVERAAIERQRDQLVIHLHQKARTDIRIAWKLINEIDPMDIPVIVVGEDNPRSTEKKVRRSTNIQPNERVWYEKIQSEGQIIVESNNIQLGKNQYDLFLVGLTLRGLAEFNPMWRADGVTIPLRDASGKITLIDIESENIDKIWQALLKTFIFQKTPQDEVPSNRTEHIDLNIQIEHVSPREASMVLNQTAIRGSDLQGRSLTNEILESENVGPIYKLTSHGSVSWLASKPYDIGEGRIAITAYVITHDMAGGHLIVARTYYRSNSQGVWRYLPGYIPSARSAIDIYDKGYGEESITLPWEVQRSLAQIATEQTPLSLEHPDLVFAGTARRRPAKATYDVEVDSTGLLLRIKETAFIGNNQLLAPEKVILQDPQQRPNYADKRAEWSTPSQMYGTIQMEVYRSYDQSLEYIMCKSQDGRVWVGGIEDNRQKVVSTGLRQSWIKGSYVTTPALEYVDQTDGFGNEAIRVGNYVDMFTNYLSKMPIIQEYMIAKAASWTELFSALGKMDKFTLPKSHPGQTLATSELKKLINQIRSNPVHINNLPEDNGLRQKVHNLLNSAN